MRLHVHIVIKLLTNSVIPVNLQFYISLTNDLLPVFGLPVLSGPVHSLGLFVADGDKVGDGECVEGAARVV